MNKLLYKLRKRLTRSLGNNINYETLKRMKKENRNVILVDVRTRDEYNYNHLAGAINIPMQYITERIGRYVPNKTSIIVLYCEYGGRSEKALKKLEKMGYVNLYNLEGGIESI